MLYSDDFLKRLENGVRGAIPNWGMPADMQVKLLTISENATYLAEDSAGGDRMIVRVHRPDYHTREQILSELAWITALREDGVVETPQPIATTGGDYLTQFSDGEHQRHAVAFSFMSGSEPDADSDQVKWYGRLGAINARLHGHARQWQKPQGFDRKVWNFDTILGPSAHWGDWRDALGLTAGGKAVLERTHEILKADTARYGEGEDRFGLVHCDMRAANLLVDGDRLGVIDFDDCGLSWYAYDFAAAISFLEHEPVVPELMASWLDGYRSVAPFSAEHEAALPMFIMLRRMQLTAWIASHAETPTAEAMGTDYTDGTVALAERYLSNHH
ncbi:phosphotransferase enzyme family protein [Martelella alba]|uniref:Phosphotransferase enzyme family protein n=1 Tax=Martelella alba TaxID=2590451 RepID=A0A506U3V3_9HYPH|nr:phosphotransferase enzyme family protein [Martelella alba]TPW28510.1 phosphotransferase enzyme family protein [Martelella alba]